MTDFDALLADIDGLAKATPKDDDGKIAAAAGEDPAAADPAAAAADPAKPDGDPDPAMAKSFTIKLEDGTEVPVMDGSGLVKALTDRVERNEGVMAKAIEGLVTLVKSQGEQIAKLGAAPQPRKAVLAITERPTPVLAKSDPVSMSGEEFMAKAMELNVNGKLTGLQVSIAEQAINAGQQPPADIVRAVLA